MANKSKRNRAAKRKQARREAAAEGRRKFEGRAPVVRLADHGPLEWTDESHRAAGEWPFKSTPPIASHVDKNRQWSVMVWRAEGANGTPYAGSLRVGIRAAVRPQQHPTKKEPAGQLLVTWSQLQAIKDTFWPHRVAVEIFPPREQIVDVAPMRWLWVLPAGCALPFNLADDTDGGLPVGGGQVPEVLPATLKVRPESETASRP